MQLQDEAQGDKYEIEALKKQVELLKKEKDQLFKRSTKPLVNQYVKDKKDGTDNKIPDKK